MTLFDQSISLSYFPTEISLSQPLRSQLGKISEKIYSEIENGEERIQNKQSVLEKKGQKNDSKLSDKLKQLQQLKQSTKLKLQQIQLSEKQIKLAHQKAKSLILHNKLQKSTLTSQEKDTIRKILHSKQKFEKSINEKVSSRLREISQQQKQQQKQKLFEKDLRKKDRIVKLTHKRYKTEENRKLEKQKDILMKKIFDDRTKNLRNYMHIRSELREKKLQSEHKKYQEVFLTEKKQSMKTDFKSLRKHSTQYQKLIADKLQETKFKLREDQLRKRAKTITYQNIFSRRLKQQDRKQRVQVLKKMNDRKETREKMLNFRNYVTQVFKPKITQQSKFVLINSTEILKQLSSSQQYAKGNQYLKVAKQRKKRLLSQQETSYQSSINILSDRFRTASSLKYPNYLQQLRSSTKFKTQNMLDKVLKEKRLTINKAEEAVRWIKKKQESNKITLGKDPKNAQFCAALDKISLLNSMYEST